MKSNSFIFIIVIFLSLILFCFCISTMPNKILAAGTSNSSSDVQLLARAINGEARGESYEGQVAVRCCYFK